MSSTYKKKLIREIEEIPEEMIPRLYRIIHILKSELAPKTLQSGIRGSLRGIWKGSQIDEALFFAARKSLFSYEYK